MRFYKVTLFVSDSYKKINNIKEFRQVTGASLPDCKHWVESDMGQGIVVVISAERLVNYMAWRALNNWSDIYLNIEIMEEYRPSVTPPIFE